MTSGFPLRPRLSDPQLLQERHITEHAYNAIAQQYALRWNEAEIASLSDARSRFAAVADDSDLIVDLGCGTGRDLRWFTDQGFRTIGLDRSLSMLRVAARAAPATAVVRGDVRHLPLRTRSVGSWWACAVLVHLDTEGFRQALVEAHRVTRPGGTGLLTVKEGSGARFEPVGDGVHRRYFYYWSDQRLDDAVHDAGWTIDEAWTAPDSLGRHAWLTRLVHRG